MHPPDSETTAGRKQAEGAGSSSPRRRWFRRILRDALFLLWVLFAAAAMLELAVRGAGYSEHYLYDPIYQPCAESPEIPYVHKPNLSGARGRGRTVVYTDGLGLRCSAASAEPPPSKAAGEYRLAVLGDSVTFGEGVPRNEDTFCAVLEAMGNASAPKGRRIRVFNFGVSAYSVREMYLTLAHRVAAVQPDAVLLAIVPEDFDLTRTPEVDAYGYTFNARLSSHLSRDSHLKRILRRLHAVYFLRDVAYQWRHRGDPPADPNEPPASYSCVRQFHAEAVRRSWRDAVVLLPSQSSSFSPALQRRLEADGMRVIDLTRLAKLFSPEQFQASRFDRHPSAAVHRAVAEALAKTLSFP